MELSVYNIKGEDTGRKVRLDDAVFGIEPNDHVMYLDVKLYLANQRQGTHKAKERSELSGSTRKLIRQKGSGGARRGDINSPVLRGGARVFGPRPRSYGFKLNKKVRDLARRTALTYKALNGEILVIENFDFDQAKTKQFTALLNALKIADKKSLFFLPELSRNVALSARNIQCTRLMRADQLNTYAVLDNKALVMTEDSLASITSKFKAEGE